MSEWTREEFEAQLALEREDREPPNPHDQVERPRQMKFYERNPAPITEDTMREYIDSAVSPFEKLARLWECESKAMNISPSASPPKEVHANRMSEFWAVWNATESA